MARFRSAILGATGVAGQQFIEALRGHPWFEISGLYASERSAGKTYGEACTWRSPVPLAEATAETAVRHTDSIVNDIDEYDVIFSALPSEVAKELEGACAQHKPVISTASAYRYEDDVPILVPEVNADHAPLVRRQQKERGWKGCVVPGPNCTAMGLIVALKPIQETIGIRRVIMTSLQALSGAGHPGHPSLDVHDNVIPFISKEEEKVQLETLKTLGRYDNGKIQFAQFKVSCTCTRVPVLDGHTLSVFVETDGPFAPDDYAAAIEKFNQKCSERFGDLPSAPARTIVLKKEQNRPQPRLDRDLDGGMATIVGRVRPDEALGTGIKFVCLSHNAKKGAAKGELLAAEYLHREGLLP